VPVWYRRHPITPRWLAPLISFVWIAGRVIYLRHYMTDPEKRVLGAGIGGATSVAMFVVALCGVMKAWLPR
jgi:hypothetical protein